jgi:hypothetical protein
MKFRFKPRFLDLAIFAVALATVIFVSLRIYSDSGDILYVHITGETGEWIEALGANKEIEVPGPLGITHVHMENGTVSVSDSPCDNKLCIGMGGIRLKHQWVACLPNNVFVRITGRTSSEDLFDAATY